MEDNVKSIVNTIVADIWDDINVRTDVRAFIDFINKNYTNEKMRNKYFTTALAGIMSKLFDVQEIQKYQDLIPAPLYFYICALQGVSSISIAKVESNDRQLNINNLFYFGKLESGISFNTVTLENSDAYGYFSTFINNKNMSLTINELNARSYGYPEMYGAGSSTHIINFKCVDDLAIKTTANLQIDNLILMPSGSIKEARYIEITSREPFKSIDVSNLPYDIRIGGSLLNLALEGKIKKIYKRNGQKILCPGIVAADKRPITEIR